MPQGERALGSPDIGEHDNGSGKSETKSKTTHDGHKSLAFNLQQPRNPQPEAVCLACQSGPRRGFHRRLPVLMLLSGSHIASGPVCQVRKQGTRSIPVGPLARSLPVTCAVARSMSPGRRMAASGVEIGYLRRVPRRPPIERPFPTVGSRFCGPRDPRRGLPSSDRLDHPFLASRIRELSRRTTTVRLVASFRCAGARKGSAHRSPSFVIMKSQPGRSPPMRQVTSLGSLPPSAYTHRHRPSPHSAYDRPPGSPHGTARMP